MSLIIDALKKAQQLRLKELEGIPLSSPPLSANKKGLSGLDQRVLIGIGLASLIVFALILWRFFLPSSNTILIQTAAPKEIKAVPPIDKRIQAPSKGILSPIPSKDIPNPEFIEGSKDIPRPEVMEGSKDILSSLKDAPSALKETASMSKDILRPKSIGGPKDVVSLSKDVPSPGFIEGPKHPRRPESIKGPKDILSLPKGAQIQKPSPKTGPSMKEKRELPPVKQVAAGQESKQTTTPPSALQASLNEKASDKSIEVKPEAEKDRPFSSEILTHFNLGVQLYNQKEFLKAIQAYQKVIELDSTYVEAYNNLGIAYQAIGDVDRAFGAYQKSIEINPQYEKGYNNLGILLYLKGRNEEAIEAFQKALAINSANIESHINLGVLFKKQEQWNKAVESYQKALHINPLHKEIHYNIALLYERLDNIDMAIAHYREFIRLSSRSYSDLVSKVQTHVKDLMESKKKK
jgi:Flp pilus assembly protein TadD